MQRKIQTLLGAFAITTVATLAGAQDAPYSQTAKSAVSHRAQSDAQTRADRLNGAAKASDLLGMTVNNYQNEKLGKVEELAVDVETGRLIQVILSTGGFIGIGDTLTAVPPGALHHDVANQVLHLDADLAKLKAAPRFELANWTTASDSNHLSTVYHYYGEKSALTFVRPSDDTSPADRLAKQNQSLIPISRLSQVQKASKLMGTEVRNLQAEKLGKVENLLVDLPAGRLVAVIVSSGGFLGLGDELSAIPPNALRFTANREALQLDASKELLSSAPHFKADQWPAFDQPSYTHGIYRAYRVDPYFTTNTVTKADNTARNVRDRQDRTLTPLDQGNSVADIDITKRIRRGIGERTDMSVNAQNVKIITNEGQVTLRGPVNTAEEKRQIGIIAIDIALVDNVDNQLEVK